MRGVLAAVFAVAALMLAPPAAAAQVPATCTLSADAAGGLVATAAGLDPAYYWGWALYAQGVAAPAGYTPWLDYGYAWSDAAGGLALALGTVAGYEAGYPGLAPYPLEFVVFGLHGSKDLIGANRLATGTGYEAACTLS